jgi:hypothetical protein
LVSSFASHGLSRNDILNCGTPNHSPFGAAARVLAVVSQLLFFVCPAHAEISFQDVTTSAGINHLGQSYGASWGDFDADGRPDIWVSNHISQPSLYRNQGDGTFQDIILDVWNGNPRDDTHGATWADFDGDADQDLIELVGAQAGKGQGPNHLFVNDNGFLIDQATSLGIEYPLARGRTALWLDWNADGLLDVILASNKRPDGQAPSALFEQVGGQFENRSVMSGFDVSQRANFAQLADLNGDTVPDLVVHGIDYPQRIYDITQQPFLDLTSSLGLAPKVDRVADAAIADFNGDLQPDIFMVRSIDPPNISDVATIAPTTIQLRLLVASDEQGIQFTSADDVRFEMQGVEKADIHIGSTGWNPTAKNFTLQISDPSIQGIAAHEPGIDRGVYIDYDPDTATWHVLMSWPSWHDLRVVVKGVAAVSGVIPLGFDPQQVFMLDRLYLAVNGIYQDQTIVSGLTAETSCVSVAAGDFDNDMDVDLYLACNRPAANASNLLYENQSDGSFVIVAGAGGAEGSPMGRANSVSIADYDADGWLDLFLTNGDYNRPFNNGPHELFRNQGGTNHWLELDLRGVISNSDAIGARVLVTAGGVTQLREQGGGVHRHSQDFSRLHFGLAGNTVAEQVQVRWPSGLIQTLVNVPADQVISIQETAPEVTIEDALIDERAGTLLLDITLSQPGSHTVTVDYATLDGTALSGVDFVAAAGQLQFLPGETRKTISLVILPDTVQEADEVFTIEIGNVDNATFSRAAATVTITRLPIFFDDVSVQAGVSYFGQSAGLAWGDFNGDRCPDFWASNHYQRAHLYINTCAGQFVAADPALFTWIPDQDSHAAAWSDFDNDGDQDLIELSGDDLNLLYENMDGRLTDIAGTMGAGLQGCPLKNNNACVLTRAQTPLWLDWNNDGLLDVLTVQAVSADSAPSALFQQAGGTFKEVGSLIGFEGTSKAQFAHLADLSGNGVPDLVLHDLSAYAKEVYELGGASLQNISASLGIPGITKVQDVAVADFNGDLAVDLFMARGGKSSDDVQQIDGQTVSFRLAGKNAEEGVRFTATGSISFDLLRFFKPSDIFIGAAGINPPATGLPRSNGLSFTLSSDDPDTWGVFDHVPAGTNGIFIGFDPALQEWVVLRSATNAPPFPPLGAVVASSGSITGLAAVNFVPFDSRGKNTLLLREGRTYTDATIQAGLDSPLTNCLAAGSGDFDNDMDVDLYLVCARPAGNIANLLYANDGQGSFELLPQAGGSAAGSVFGMGDSVAIADYDQDGFLDLLVANSDRDMTFDGPNQLLRNAGNQNHWLEIDLQGVASNRDGIGARLTLETPDGTMQVREQSGGVHRFAQNHQRVHFGMGGNSKVRRLVVDWPSGIRQEIWNIVADQVVEVIESVEPDILGKPDMASGQSGMFIWQDSPAGPYHLRIKADSRSIYDVKLVTTEPLLTIEPIKLEGKDSLQSTEYGFSLHAAVDSKEDGVDFSLSPGTRAMISVERDGVANPRQLHVGILGAPLSPAGWIKAFQELPLRPDFVAGQNLGLFIGRGPASGMLEGRLNGDGPRRASSITIIASTPLAGITPVKLEANDILTQTASSVEIKGWLGPKIDGIDLSVSLGANIGLVYQQDNLVAPLSVNRDVGKLGPPNAYWLPASGL